MKKTYGLEYRNKVSKHFMGMITSVTNIELKEVDDSKMLMLSINDNTYMSLVGNDIVVEDDKIIIYYND